MRIAAMVWTGDGGRAAPALWSAAGILTADNPDGSGATYPVRNDAVAGARVVSLALESNGLRPHGDRSPHDIELQFGGSFELRLRQSPRAACAGGMALTARRSPPLDHVTVCVHRENLEAYAEQLCERLPAATCESYQVGSAHSGMRIAAVEDAEADVHVVLAAPAGSAGQVADFLAITGCEGLQHVAFSVPSVCTALRALEDYGLRFVGSTPERPAGAIIELREQERWLRQAFTEPLWGEFFVEIVERNGIAGLHPSNIQSLYDVNDLSRQQVSAAPAARAVR